MTPTTLEYLKFQMPILALEICIRLKYRLMQNRSKLTLNGSTPTPEVIPTTLKYNEFQMQILALEIDIRLDYKLI